MRLVSRDEEESILGGMLHHSQRLGLWRGKRLALIWEDGYAELLARRLWIEYHKTRVPYHHDIFHKNGDSLDFGVDNLECLPGSPE